MTSIRSAAAHVADRFCLLQVHKEWVPRMINGDKQAKRLASERGSVMIMTAILMAGIILAVGLCIDVARVYMVRTELQNAADAAALAAARELDSGAGGIQ
ncbi:MAG TPA: pilus assembly protein TadG-related protein, partial [Patescibacteria group bacterium]|nr:pilus assembly protein TadG-related protein [Patescibacteria group bacterium]